MMKRGLILFAIVLFASMQFISASHTISPTSFSKDVYVSSYTITIDNTDTDNAGISNGNITNVSIIFPSSFTFISGSSSTSSSSIFSSSSGVLSWYNISSGGYVIGSATGGDNSKTFSFNLNATSLGNFNVTVRTTNATGNFDFGVNFKINDTSSPDVTLNAPANNDDDADGVLVFDCSATDNYALSSIALHIWDNSSAEVGSIVLKTNGTSNQSTFDYSFSSDGSYKWNCFANDTLGNFDWGSNRTITISASANSCTPSWDCDDWNSCTNETQTRVCIDSNSCGNNGTKPAEIQSCAAECTPSWDCTDWAPIQCPETEEQTRTCIDSNDCSSATGKPTEKRSCTAQSGTSWTFITVILGLIALGGVAGAVFYFRSKPKDSFNTQTPTTQNYTGNNSYGSAANSQGYTYKYS